MGIIKSVIGLAAGIIVGCIAVLVFGAVLAGPIAESGDNDLFSNIVVFLFTFPGAIVTVGFFAVCGAMGTLRFTMSEKKFGR